MRENPKLNDACSITTGKLDSNHFVVGGKYPFFTCAPEPLTIDSYAFNDSVILVAGNNASGNFHISRYKGKFNAYQRTYVLTAKPGYDLDYIYYSLRLELKRLSEKSQGSQTKFLTLPILKDIDIGRRELPLQQKIARVLCALDSKIELNNRINAELEAMAKTLYDYWFVQFDFPDEHGKPYKSSGGKIEWNPELKREIPKGWKVEAIEKSCQIVDCLHSKKPDSEFEDEDCYLLQLENIRDNGLLNLTNRYFVSKKVYQIWTSRIEVKEDDIIITNAGRVAATSQVPQGIKTGIGRNITAIRPVSINPTYLFLAFRGLDMKRQIKWNTDSGAFFTSLNVKGIKKLFIVRPPDRLEMEFENIVHSIRRQRETNNFENQRLAELRDWLLPMLLNGQVKVRAPTDKNPVTESLH
jgi:type I restriction enzyme, S subunit